MIHKPTAPPRKLSFHSWSLPSFIICPLQCKAGKSKQCLWSLSYGHVHPRPCCKPVKMKEPSIVELITQSHPLSTKELRFVLPQTQFYSWGSEGYRTPCPTSHPPPQPSTQCSTQTDISRVGMVTQCQQLRQGLEPSLLLIFMLTNSSRLRMRLRIPADWEQFGLHSLKWLHFLQICRACEGKPI